MRTKQLDMMRRLAPKRLLRRALKLQRCSGWVRHAWLFALLVALPVKASEGPADRSVVDKIYHPYVQAYEQEVEYRYAYFRQPGHVDNNSMTQRLGYGRAIASNMALEGYVHAQRDMYDDYHIRGYELELRYMLTEQGEYSADWGMLFELERTNHLENYELKTGLLMEKEFTDTSLTLNALALVQWGGAVKEAIKGQFRAQYRYRWLPQVQPALEYYSGEHYQALGPSLMGVQKFGQMKVLKWELAVIFGVDQDTVDHTVRFALEYEF